MLLARAFPIKLSKGGGDGGMQDGLPTHLVVKWYHGKCSLTVGWVGVPFSFPLLPL